MIQKAKTRHSEHLRKWKNGSVWLVEIRTTQIETGSKVK